MWCRVKSMGLSVWRHIICTVYVNVFYVRMYEYVYRALFQCICKLDDGRGGSGGGGSSSGGWTTTTTTTTNTINTTTNTTTTTV